jgi:hypothetical protein
MFKEALQILEHQLLSATAQIQETVLRLVKWSNIDIEELTKELWKEMKITLHSKLKTPK